MTARHASDDLTPPADRVSSARHIAEIICATPNYQGGSPWLSLALLIVGETLHPRVWRIRIDL